MLQSSIKDMQPHPRRDYTSQAFVFPRPPTLKCITHPAHIADWRARATAFAAVPPCSKAAWKRAGGWLRLLAQDLVSTGHWRAAKAKGALLALVCESTVYGAPLRPAFALAIPDAPTPAAFAALAGALECAEFRTLRDDFPPLRDMVHVLQCVNMGVLFVLEDEHRGVTAKTVTPHLGWLQRNARWVMGIWGEQGWQALARAAEGCRLYDKKGREFS